MTYGIAAAAGGAIFLALAVQLYRAGDTPRADKAAKLLFGYSILYLFALFAVLLIENRVFALIGAGA
jgi:protoheme IX farnesyltransferase